MNYIEKNGYKKKEMEKRGIFYEKDSRGEFVRIKFSGFDFLLSLFEDGFEDSYEKSMNHVHGKGFRLPSKNEWMVIGFFIDEISKVIKDHQGDELKGWYWSASKTPNFEDYLACYYNHDNGKMDDCLLFYPLLVRAVADPVKIS